MGWSEGARTTVHVAAKGKEKVNRMIVMAGATKVNHLGAMAFKGEIFRYIWKITVF